MDRRHYPVAGLILALVALCTVALGGLVATPLEPSALTSFAAASTISTDQYMEHVRFLAAPDMKGRGNGSPELDRAANYIAAQFRLMGLRPAGDRGTYFQTFELITDTELGAGSRLTLGSQELSPGEDFSALRLTAPAEAAGPLVFVGYGITAPEMHWDDYAGVDVTGKIVVAFRHEPQENDENSPFDGTRFTSHATLMNKAINAKQHGAAGIIFILDPNNHTAGEDEILQTATRTATDNSGIAALVARTEPVVSFFRTAGYDLAELQREIDSRLESRSFEAPGNALVKADVVRIRKPVRNVVAAIEGSDPQLRHEWVILGAHYDHLGLDGEFSLDSNGDGQIHHGADDNASGTSGVLEIARVAATHRTSFGRSVLLIAFAGEEIGLRGSSNFVSNPTIEIDNAIAMLNLDMIGRVREDHLYVSGVGTSPNFQAALEEINGPMGISLDYSDSGMGASDHMSFNIRGIPVLFFFSGLHSDYHKPSDTAEKIDATGARRVLMLAYQMLNQLANDPERPLYTEVAQPRPAGGGGGGGYGVYFGSIPDFRDDLNGVLFADVSSESPAAAAGFRPGDLLVEFNGKTIENLYDFTYALQAEAPGNTVTVVVLRDGQAVAADVTLRAR